MSRIPSNTGRWRTAVFCGAAIAVLVAGCVERPRAKNGPAPPIPYVDLPAAHKSPLMEMQDELARISSERALPAVLLHSTVPEERNLAARMAKAFVDARYDTTDLEQQSARIMPREEFKLDPEWEPRADRFLSMLDKPHDKIRRMLADESMQFELPRERGFGINQRVLDAVQVFARLEAFDAAAALRDGELDRALDCVERIFRVAMLLGERTDPTSRVMAAYVRTDGLKVLQRIVDDRKFQRRHLERIDDIVRGQLTAWPHDADAWLGERAHGLWIYEHFHDGKGNDVLTGEDRENLGAEHLLPGGDSSKSKSMLQALEDRTSAELYQDELYYLLAMRRIIDGCGKPYFLRKPIFEDIERDLGSRLGQNEYPIIAGRLLLTEIQDAQAVLARDRSNMQAWGVACGRSLGAGAPASWGTNPITGEPFTVRVRADALGQWDGGVVEVRDIGRPTPFRSDEYVFVPNFGPAPETHP